MNDEPPLFDGFLKLIADNPERVGHSFLVLLATFAHCPSPVCAQARRSSRFGHRLRHEERRRGSSRGNTQSCNISNAVPCLRCDA